MSFPAGNEHPRVIPAHLSYLALYNPSLGPTDETVRDQIVFYYSSRQSSNGERAKRLQREAGLDQSSQDALRQDRPEDSGETKENERLRQVGLAQGMVEFVKNFSGGVPLESIEGEKSRTVLKEVEPQWWILASVELTQLPTTNTSHGSSAKRSTSSGKDGAEGPQMADINDVEYSAREVAPATLLLRQLLQAHRIFLLHHASSLSELWKKHSDNRQRFCNLLDRYWTKFALDWDVLLHGNPVVELYDGIKIAGGGELGVGVGEESWGSGEREVLEGFAHRTEGLLDLVVGRYGDAPSPAIKETGRINSKDAASAPQVPGPWLGNGESSRAQDGIVFSGIEAVSRRSLATISQWMESIFTHGESAYGVGENPSSQPRRRKRRRKVPGTGHEVVSGGSLGRVKQQQREELSSRRVKSTHGQTSDLRKRALENNSLSPVIPPPLVSAVERSLENATINASKPLASGTQEGSKSNEIGDRATGNPTQDESIFGTDKMMKYLSLGYGSSWTLNPKGFGPNSSSATEVKPTSTTTPQEEASSEYGHPADLIQIDPTPEVSDEESLERPFVQRLEQSIGKFLIGLSGDLENTEFEEDEMEAPPTGEDTMPGKESARSAAAASTSSRRIFLRTLTVEVSSSRFRLLATQDHRPHPTHATLPEDDVGPDLAGGKTSAAASIDGANPNPTHERLQVVVYVHQPFIFVFLFQLHTPNLSMPAFYHSIHHTLGPLQRSLLRSTDPERLVERMREISGFGADKPTTDSGTGQHESSTRNPLGIYDFLYDPLRLTIRTSIPSIPIPGSLAAEGLRPPQGVSQRPVTVSGSWYTLGIPIGSLTSSTSSPGTASGLVNSDWTRVDALNTYTHLLNIWADTRSKGAGPNNSRVASEEIERSIKTSRGWWVVWMRIRAPKQDSNQSQDIMSKQSSPTLQAPPFQEAFLVRRSPHEHGSGRRDASGARVDARTTSSTGRWLLREQPRSREVSGSGTGNGASSATTNARAVGEGVGIDARKWVEGLVRLSM